MIPRYRAWLKEDKEMVDVEEINEAKKNEYRFLVA